MTQSMIPSAAPMDSVMANADDIQRMSDWALQAFAGKQPEAAADKVSLQLIRQDHSALSFGESCMNTPITIGDRKFKHGLGTHANSEIKVSLPKGAAALHAFIGVDNNYDTQGQSGSVRFHVEAGGKELFVSPVMRGGEAPLEASVKIPEGADAILLKVDDGGDGPGWDQCDWADARIEMADGSSVWLDETASSHLMMSENPPISFLCGGVSSEEIFRRAEKSVSQEDATDRTLLDVAWKDATTGLSIHAKATLFKEFPAAEWVVYFENQGDKNSPILENIQPLDTQLRTANTKKSTVLHQILGDACNERSFQPIDTPLEVGKSIQFAPENGRSSNGVFPFFNFEYQGEGVIAGIGWSGQWAASLERSKQGPTNLTAGMQLTRLYLKPGEKIRTPRILLMQWKGDRIDAHNRFRRLILHKYAPKIDNLPAPLPIVSQCFDRYSWTRPEWATEAGQIEAARFAKNIGCDTHWLDAAWFVGGFPNGVGNWFTKPKEFPNGLKPVGAACDELGVKFVVWFEPERVAAGSEIAREHPQFVHGGEKGGLFKLDDPDARHWLTELLSSRITEYGIDIYRNDFNIDPLTFWRNNDETDRQGMTEIRYVEGLYEMWDKLRADHPGMLIDNCASGGRRIDLETCSRSVPFWRSDTSCSPGHPDWDQLQTAGLSQYIPLFMACGWAPDPYTFRSSATAGAICQWDYMNPDFPMEMAKASIAEVKENTKYWYGDFYPITSPTISPDCWMAYQFHRPDLNAGIVLVFRRADSKYTGLEISLRALDKAQTYQMESIDDKREKTNAKLSGEALLSGYEVRLPEKGSSLLIRYSVAP